MFDAALDVIQDVLKDHPGTSGGIVVTSLVRSPGQLPMQVLKDLRTALVQSTRASSGDRITGLSALAEFMTTWTNGPSGIVYQYDDLVILRERLLPLKGRV